MTLTLGGIYMKVLFSIGMFNIHFFGTMIFFGFIAALWVLAYEAKRYNIKTSKIYDMATIGIIGGVIGARIGYVLFYNFQYYLQNPLEIIKVADGGLSIHGGIIGGIVFVMIYLNKNKDLNVLEISDIIAPALILAQGIGRIGCDVYGRVMVEPKFWGIPINGLVYHPAQMYEFVLDFLFFLYLWRKRKKVKYKGQLFGIYMIGYAVIRGIVELTRNNPQVFGVFSISYLLSALFILLGFLWLIIAKRKHTLVSDEEHMRNGKSSSLDIIVVLLLILASIVIFYSVQLLL